MELEWTGPHESWNNYKFWKLYFKDTQPKLDEIEERGTEVFPPRAVRFDAFQLGLDEIKVVILGQDPYPTKGVAHGYAFSTLPHVKPLPPSLRNIFNEYEEDLQFPRPRNGDLRDWASRGVFLLNTALTVESGRPGSHLDIWSKFTYGVMQALSEQRHTIVWVLLGNKAQEFQALVPPHHHVITAGHPSPLNRSGTFLGSKIFTKTCNLLNLPKEFWKLS